MSFGAGEFGGETFYDSVFTTPAGHQGVTFLASTGDGGAPGGYPAYSPNVVAVGGTTLSVSGNNYVSESGWSGSGGGISTIENKPSLSIRPSRRAPTSAPTPTSRSTPIPTPACRSTIRSTRARPHRGSRSAGPAFRRRAGAPHRDRRPRPRAVGAGTLDGAGDTLPTIYSMPATNFHDITTGNNGFAAAVGYDLVTGRGSPRADLVAAAFVGNAVALPQLAVGQDHGPSSTDNITNINQPTFTGTATAGATVDILSDGNVVGTGVASGGGSYSIAIGSTLADGQHSIQARVNATFPVRFCSRSTRSHRSS